MSSADYERPTFGEGVKNLTKVVFGIPLFLLWFGWMLTFGLVIGISVFIVTECFGWGRDENGDLTGGLEAFIGFNFPFLIATEGPPIRSDSTRGRRSRSFPHRRGDR